MWLDPGGGALQGAGQSRGRGPRGGDWDYPVQRSWGWAASFATAKSLWVYYKAELGGRGAGQRRQSLAQRKESGSRELTSAGGTCSPRSGQQRAGQEPGTAERRAISRAGP